MGDGVQMWKTSCFLSNILSDNSGPPELQKVPRPRFRPKTYAFEPIGHFDVFTTVGNSLTLIWCWTESVCLRFGPDRCRK